MPFVRRTLATFRMAEFGFFGVRVITWRQTPRRKGAPAKAGALLLYVSFSRPLRTSWLIVGIGGQNFSAKNHPGVATGAQKVSTSNFSAIRILRFLGSLDFLRWILSLGSTEKAKRFPAMRLIYAFRYPLKAELALWERAQLQPWTGGGILERGAKRVRPLRP
jgi:hypothetical protein